MLVFSSYIHIKSCYTIQDSGDTKFTCVKICEVSFLNLLFDSKDNVSQMEVSHIPLINRRNVKQTNRRTDKAIKVSQLEIAVLAETPVHIFYLAVK